MTRKGVSARLQVSREIVRDRLEILEVSEELHARAKRQRLARTRVGESGESA